MTAVRRLLRDRRGGISIIAAAVGGIMCAVAALAIDLGAVALDARRLQGAADLAALSAAADMPHAEALAQGTAVGNSRPDVQVETTIGRYTADKAIAPANRFVTGGTEPNAVQVTLRSQSPLFFGSLVLKKPSLELTRSATATIRSEPRAAFSIGSRLASLDGGLANQLLSGLTGSSVSLSVMDYNALADADVELLTYSKALATELNVEVADYDSLLNREITTGRALKILSDIADSASHSALSRLSTAAGGQKMRVGDLIAVDPGGEDLFADGLQAKIAALDLAMAIVEIGAVDRQVALNFGVQPGLASVTASLAIGERPNDTAWLTVTRSGQPIIRTAQARLFLKARTSQKLSGLAQVDLPVLVELAASEARLEDIDCTGDRSVTLGVRPGLARASIASVNEAALPHFTTALTRTPATLLSVAGLVKITGLADVEVADQAFKPTIFHKADIDALTIKTVHTTQIGSSLVSSLIQRLSLDVDVLGLGLGLGSLTHALGVLLSPLGPVLDGILNPLLDLAGLHFGEADVKVNGLTCGLGGARLVG